MRSNKLHGDTAECAEIGVQRVALLGVHHPRERAGENQMAGLERDAMLAELVGEPGDAQRRMAEHAGGDAGLLDLRIAVHDAADPAQIDVERPHRPSADDNADGGRVPHENYCLPRVEIELAFVLGKPLKGPGVGLLEVLRATEFVVPSIEIIDARVQNPRKIFDTVADNGAAAGIVLGGRPVGPMDVDLRWVSGLMYRNSEIEETGVAAGVLGHPAMGIAWLANKVGKFGTTLEPGHVVLAGSFTRPVWAQKGDTLRADFGTLGSLSVQFV